MGYDEQLGSVDSTPCRRHRGKERLQWCEPHTAVDWLPWLRNAYSSCKDNKSKIIDCSTVLECFWAHQSHFYHGLQRLLQMRSEMDSAATNALFFCRVSWSQVTDFIFRWKRKRRKTNNAWNDNQSLELLASTFFPVSCWLIGHVVIIIMAKLRLFTFESNC